MTEMVIVIIKAETQGPEPSRHRGGKRKEMHLTDNEEGAMSGDQLKAEDKVEGRAKDGS
jgi:hypothetical protein